MASRTGYGTLPYGGGPYGGVVAYSATVDVEQIEGGILVTTTNPHPGDERLILGNIIERRSPGGEWAEVGRVDEDGFYSDLDVTPTLALEYRAIPYQDAPYLALPSPSAGITYSPLGVVLYALDDPATLRSFPYKADGGSEKLTVESVSRSFIGRSRPAIDFGPASTRDVGKAVLVPFDAEHDAAVQWWRDRFFGHDRLCLRDGRGRHLHGFFGDSLDIQDEEGGTSVAFAFHETDAVL